MISCMNHHRLIIQKYPKIFGLYFYGININLFLSYPFRAYRINWGMLGDVEKLGLNRQ